MGCHCLLPSYILGDCSSSFIPHHHQRPWVVDTHAVSILQTWKLRHREAKPLVQVHTAGQQRERYSRATCHQNLSGTSAPGQGQVSEKCPRWTEEEEGGPRGSSLQPSLRGKQLQPHRLPPGPATALLISPSLLESQVFLVDLCGSSHMKAGLVCLVQSHGPGPCQYLIHFSQDLWDQLSINWSFVAQMQPQG